MEEGGLRQPSVMQVCEVICVSLLARLLLKPHAEFYGSALAAGFR
jgi:hypothetical protein